MARPLATPEAHLNGAQATNAATTLDRSGATKVEPEASLDEWAGDLRQEMERLAEENRNLLASLGGQADTADAASPEQDQRARLQVENMELRARVRDLQRQLDEASQQPADGWEER